MHISFVLPAGTVPRPFGRNELSSLTYSISHSDTTSATLTNVLFHLAKYPDLRKDLQRQIAGLPNLSNDRLSSLSLLDALINETMRLHPVVPSGIQRMTPPEGIVIGDNYIPGDVMVCIPMHTLFRGEFATEFSGSRY